MTPHIPDVGAKFRVRRPTGYEATVRVLAVFTEALHAQIVWTYEAHILHGYVDPEHWSEWPSVGGITRSTVLDFFSNVLEAVTA